MRNRFKVLQRWLTMVVAILLSFVSLAQNDTAVVKLPVHFNKFLWLVGKQHPGYVAEQFNVDIAEASAEAARGFPDPDLALAANDNGQRRMRMGYGFGASVTWQLELGGKRKARIGLAETQAGLSRALLDNFFRNLRADAANAYLHALRQREIFTVQSDSYKNMLQIADADSIRFRLGQIASVDARQSRLEAAQMYNDVIRGEADWRSALVQLSQFMGISSADTLYVPAGELIIPDRDFNPVELMKEAELNRAEVVVALKNIQVAEQSIRLAKANRIADLTLNAGVNAASVVSNKVAPTPSYTAVTAGISIPLKFSNNNKGELAAANFGQQQAAALYRQTALQIRGEVMLAWQNFTASRKQVAQFQSGLLAAAAAVLEGKSYSYKRGETSLLELLNAQRTYNEIRLNYVDALFNYAASLVEIEKAAGLWDLNF